MSILFVNGSPNQEGNTNKLAKILLADKEFKTLRLVDYRINCYGQKLEGDQFDEVLSKMEEASTVVVGSPIYWHNICGSVRNLLDRCYGSVKKDQFKGKKLAFVYQGASPEAWMIESGEFTIIRFAKLYGFEYLGMATQFSEAKELSKKI